MKNEIEKKISNIISQPTISSESEAAYLMILIRKRIEQDPGNKGKYLTLNFYCDWIAHAKIDRSSPGMNILNDVNEWINKLKNTNNPSLIKDLPRVIATQRLREEMTTFFSDFNLPTKLASDDNKWKSFLWLLMEIIHTSPVSFPINKNKSIKHIYNATTGNPIKTGMWVESFSIMNKDEIASLLNDTPPNNSQYFLRILTSDTTSIISPLFIKCPLILLTLCPFLSL